MKAKIRRRELLIGAAASILASPTLAHDHDIETIIVYADGRRQSSYPDSELAKDMKRMAVVASGLYKGLAASTLTVGLGAAGILAGSPDPTISKPTAAGIVISAGGFSLVAISMAELLTAIADDPPRKNYKQQACGGLLYRKLPEPSGALAPIGQFLAEMNIAGGHAGQLFHSMELFWGAKIAADRQWMQVHLTSWNQAYRNLYESVHKQERLLQPALQAFDGIPNMLKIDHDEFYELSRSNFSQGLRETQKRASSYAASLNPCFSNPIGNPDRLWTRLSIQRPNAGQLRNSFSSAIASMPKPVDWTLEPG